MRLLRRSNERGSAIIEFAIVLPLLLFVLFSMVDFGRYLYVRISLSSTSFEVADAIARGLFTVSDNSESKQSKMEIIASDISPGIAGFAQLRSSGATLTFSPVPDACPNATGLTKVAVSTSFESISPIVDFFSEVSHSSSMRCLR